MDEIIKELRQRENELYELYDNDPINKFQKLNKFARMDSHNYQSLVNELSKGLSPEEFGIILAHQKHFLNSFNEYLNSKEV